MDKQKFSLQFSSNKKINFLVITLLVSVALAGIVLMIPSVQNAVINLTERVLHRTLRDHSKWQTMMTFFAILLISVECILVPFYFKFRSTIKLSALIYNFWITINGGYGLILIFYTILIILFQSMTEDIYLTFGSFWFTPILVIIVVIKLTPVVSQFSINTKVDNYNCYMPHQKQKSFFIFFGISFAYLLLWQVACFPGAFSPDSINQYSQALSHNYNDWHPVLQTLIAFSFPMIFSKQPALIIFFQIVEFSLVLAYATASLAKYCKSLFFITASFCYALLNPLTGNIIMYPWKDCTFAITALLCVAFAINIYMTHGKWLLKTSHKIYFVISVVVATIVRHNSILFTLPFLISILLLCKQKRERLVLIFGFIFCFCAIKNVLYPVLKVEKPDKRQSEMVGLPMTIIAAAVKEHPERLNEMTQKFVYSISSEEVWKNYDTGNWNSIKWNVDRNRSTIDEITPEKIFAITFHCVKVAPRQTLNAFCRLTGMVWQIAGKRNWGMRTHITENNFGIKKNGNSLLLNILTITTEICEHSILQYVFYFTGVINFCLLFIILSKGSIRKYYKKYLLVLPVFAYNFGTMLLLSGFDFRFFYYNFLLAPFEIFILLAKDETESSQPSTSSFPHANQTTNILETSK